MLKLIAYLINKGVATVPIIPESLEEGTLGFPRLSSESCPSICSLCIESCPTDAITKVDEELTIDRGSCITCGLCISVCPEKLLANDATVNTYAYNREDLHSSSAAKAKPDRGLYAASFAIRVVSTGCAACDLEVAAASNPIFDVERFGIQIVASPRFADALLITGPVPKAMHLPLRSCYDAMAAPRIVIACGTCAISGGVHKDGYTEANGVNIPVDVYIPGCPPHPWQIITGIQAARKLKGR
ncbi:MAG TPA: NADH-quinone oxidoreductase subunit NuoB [Planktothrix sp.]|jgi:Ni,Fe-hydrogenase III small subunit/Pyruvate/2-oxoacid:ferredoxin oxidoreductase delta subunit